MASPLLVFRWQNGGDMNAPQLLTTEPSTPPASPFTYRDRIVTDGTNRVEWLRARSRGITATDAAKLSTPKSVEQVAWNKLYGSGFSGNAFTEHGKRREPEIAEWVRTEFDIESSQALFHAPHDRRHLATPDGIGERDGGVLELAEIKTTNKPWRSIPKHYMRQIWWQQYVLGAERTLMVWELHRDFVPVGDLQYRWVDRDDNEIEKLLGLVDQVINTLIARTQ